MPLERKAHIHEFYMLVSFLVCIQQGFPYSQNAGILPRIAFLEAAGEPKVSIPVGEQADRPAYNLFLELDDKDFAYFLQPVLLYQQQKKGNAGKVLAQLGGIVLFQHLGELQHLFFRFGHMHGGSAIQSLLYLAAARIAQPLFRSLAMERIVDTQPVHRKIAVFAEMPVSEQGIVQVAELYQETTFEQAVRQMAQHAPENLLLILFDKIVSCTIYLASGHRRRETIYVSADNRQKTCRRLLALVCDHHKRAVAGSLFKDPEQLYGMEQVVSGQRGNIRSCTVCNKPVCHFLTKVLNLFHNRMFLAKRFIFAVKILHTDMENFSELIKRRRSMRKFTEEELSQDEVVALLKAALMAPSSHRSNGWQFVVVDDKETLKKLSQCKEAGAALIAEAPLAIVVMADPLASDVWIEDASIASILIQLQAEDLGLGSCWVQVRERQAADGTAANDIVHEILDIPLQLQVLSIIAVGHKGMERKPFNEDNLQWEKVHINRYGGK